MPLTRYFLFLQRRTTASLINAVSLPCAMHLDQHFMIDERLLGRIVAAAALTPDDVVLEAGPGRGALTQHLLAAKAHVLAIEMDPVLVETLQRRFAKELASGQLELVGGNVLEDAFGLSFTKSVSNLPYAISEPFLKLLLRANPVRAVLVVSDSFAENLTSGQTKLSLLANAQYELTLAEIIAPHAFSPSPRTDSALIVLNARESLSEEQLVLVELSRQLDKKAYNALVEALCRVRRETKRAAKAEVFAAASAGPPDEVAAHDHVLEQNLDRLSNPGFLRLLKLVRTILGK